jgi:hypothetical protein
MNCPSKKWKLHKTSPRFDPLPFFSDFHPPQISPKKEKKKTKTQKKTNKEKKNLFFSEIPITI